jgi:tetratricopeptide (TPR) repeat protein
MERIRQLIGGEIALGRNVDQPRRRRRRTAELVDLADRARDAGQWEVAAQLHRKALDRDPRNPGIWVQYGHALKESGGLRDPEKLAQAEAAYRRALSLDPGAADTYLQIGHVLKLQGKIEEAQAAFLRAFVLDSSMPHPLQELSGLGRSEAHFFELRAMVGKGVGPLARFSVDGHLQSARGQQEDPASHRSPKNGFPGIAESSRAHSSTFVSSNFEDMQLISHSGLFDAVWYLEKYKDARDAGVDPLLHYLRFGAAEGRDPNRLFDSDWYLATYPDVAAAGMDPLVHYVRSGAAEGRAPHPLFDTAWYLKMNPDVAGSGSIR